ncbi:AEC family transporter [Polaromonas glacialis]|uniref:AEC family transporter n=1 Tax=Polaromonas glacialis TaxID=866564 RepID=UPI000494F83B|nr:AEC family transporter [Polaromonas glacialis]
MLNILAVTFPFFALVLCGYVAARRALLPQAAIPGLNTFVLYFALPCMLYRFGASTPIAQLLDGSLIAVYLLCALLIVAFTVAVTLRRDQGASEGAGWNNAAFGALVAAFPNTGFMGVPLLVALLGAQAAGPAIVTIVIDMLVTSSLCIALSRLDGADEHGAARAGRLALKSVVANPLPWSIALGALASGMEFALPKPIMGTLSLLADAASPVALFTIGAVLARSQMNSASRTPVGRYMPIALIKLIVHPVLVGGLGLGAIALGLPLDRFTLTVLVLVAALPSASNVALLAERFGADSGRIARIILLSTVLAFFSFSAAVAWLV